jgi:mRNA interferase RelE/StbE
VNDIYWQPKALRQLRKLDPKVVDQIRRAVSVELVDLKQAKQVKALTNHVFGYRLRVGNYRVFFNVDGVVRIATIEEVRKRDERTY